MQRENKDVSCGRMHYDHSQRNRVVDKSGAVNQIYSNQKIKQLFIDYIYSVIDPSKYKYKILRMKDDLHMLSATKHYISGNYVGGNCLLVFMRNKDRYYSFLVERKTLSYDVSKINIDHVNVTPIVVGLEKGIYEGTIMDGIYVQNGGMKKYIVTDVYTFRGEDLTHEKMVYKLINIKKYFDAYCNYDENLNNIQLAVNNLSEMNEIEILLKKIGYRNNGSQNTINQTVCGIAFYPEISGTRLIYLFNAKTEDDYVRSDTIINGRSPYDGEQIAFPTKGEYGRRENTRYSQFAHRDEGGDRYPKVNNSTLHGNNQYEHNNIGCIRTFKNTREIEKNDEYSKPIHSKVMINDDIEQTRKKLRFVNKTDDEVVLTFEMKKTEQPDVYKLFLVRQVEKILKTKKIGIAYIPTLECSKMCRELTQETGKVLMKCVYEERVGKWKPMEIDTKKKCPDYYSTLEEKMEIIIDSE